MSGFAPWDLGAHLPPDTARAKDGRRVRIIPNPAVPVPAIMAVPRLSAETDTWAKPSASACFPLHPLGVLTLYQRARRLLLHSGVTTDLTPEQLSHTEACVWRFAAKLYSPGHSIRACIDAAVEARGFKLREEDDRDPFLAQPGHLAAWLVLRAALDWAQEAA